MGFFQITVPLVLSTHQRERSFPSATLRKMLLFQIIGVAPVLLGMANFQATFSVVLQWTGRFFSLLMPFAPGPRHCGQFSARAGMPSAARNNAMGFGLSKRSLL